MGAKRSWVAFPLDAHLQVEMGVGGAGLEEMEHGYLFLGLLIYFMKSRDRTAQLQAVSNLRTEPLAGFDE